MIYLFWFFILGACLGSFANVLIYRMQQKGPLSLLGRSYCPACKYKIPLYLNIPLISWLALRGTCKNCKAQIPFRYWLVEVITASLFASLFFVIGWKWFLIEALIFSFGLVVVSFIDLDQMILPDSFTLSGIVLGLVGAFFNPERQLLMSFLGAFIGGFSLWFVAYIYMLIRKREGMGGGDLKLLAWIGAVLGLKSLYYVISIACVLGICVGGLFILRSKKDMSVPIPFGPYLALGALCYIFYSYSV